MNINIIQPGQISQNANKSSERVEPAPLAGRGHGTSLSSLPDAGPSPQTAEAAIVAGIGYLKEQLDTLLTSFPPFFPVGSYQRPDLIKRIQTIEERIGASSLAEDIKQLFSDEKLPIDATDPEISVALDRLLEVKARLEDKPDFSKEKVKPGSFLNLKV